MRLESSRSIKRVPILVVVHFVWFFSPPKSIRLSHRIAAKRVKLRPSSILIFRYLEGKMIVLFIVEVTGSKLKILEAIMVKRQLQKIEKVSYGTFSRCQQLFGEPFQSK